MSGKTFQIMFGAGMMTTAPDGAEEPFGGELVFYRSDRPIAAGVASMYRPAPNSLVEYARVPVRQGNGRSVSDPVTLETTSVCGAGELARDAPRTVYSCVHVQNGRESFVFDGFRVPETLSERTTWQALVVANQRPEDRGCTVEEAERHEPLKRAEEKWATEL